MNDTLPSIICRLNLFHTRTTAATQKTFIVHPAIQHFKFTTKYQVCWDGRWAVQSFVADPMEKHGHFTRRTIMGYDDCVET